MKIKLKKIRESAQLPKQAREGDMCFDVVATTEEEIAPNVWRYGLGWKYEMERDDVNKIFLAFDPLRIPNVLDNYTMSIDFRPRSSIWKTGMSLSNGPGTLDEFYRGEAMAIFYHVLPNMERYHVGDKIGQIKVGIAPKVKFEFVDEINEDTERGAGGFGSTGNN